MTDDILAKAKALEEDRKAIGEDIEKFKNTYAKYIISDGDKIKESIAHPYVVTKKDVRKKKIQNFFNKIKKAIGL